MALFIDLDSVPSPSPPGSTPSTAQVWLGDAHIDFASGEDLGALATGLVINTAGVPSVVAHGTDGYVLTMSGGAPVWAVPSGGGGAGDIEGVTAGAGMTGGGTTGTVTLNVATADATIVINADSIQAGVMQTANIADDAITYAKMQNAATGASVLGKTSAGAGNFAEILSGADGQVLRRVGGGVNFGTIGEAGTFAGSATNGYVLTLVVGVPTWAAASGGVTDHGALTGLGDDDHTIYPLLAGRSGGQTWIGGTASGDDILMQSTSHGTKGYVGMGSLSTGLIYDEVNNRLSLGATSVASLVDGDPMKWGVTDGTRQIGFLTTGFGGSYWLELADGTRAIYLGSDTVSGFVGTGTNHQFETKTNNTTRALWTGSGNYGIFTTTGSFGSGVGVMFVGNAGTPPSGNPSAGFLLYGASGQPTFLDDDGVVTQL